MMMKFLIYFLYRPLFAILKSLLPLFKSRLDEKTLAWFKLREEENKISFSPADNVFWFHASSGEIEYAKALIRELKKTQPQATVVVTYSSPSAVRLFENIKPLVNQFIPLPWDQPKPLVKLISQLNPKAVIFARTDLWPEFIFQLKQKHIPTFVASYNPSLSNGNRFFIGTFLNHFAGIFCVHPTQESVLHSIVRKEVYVSSPGDTRFDQVFWRLAQPSKSPITFDFRYGVLGSTWPEDEKIILPVLSDVLEKGFKIFWCPHETNVSNIERIQIDLLALKINFTLFSDILSGKPFDQAQVILVDKIGYLADLYRTAAWAFVGGSFKSKVHSVMEPLCCAIPVITGPMITNSPEALRYHQVIMNNIRVVQVVQNSSEFNHAVQVTQTMQLGDFKKMLIGHLEQNRYASAKIIKIILDTVQEKLNS